MLAALATNSYVVEHLVFLRVWWRCCCCSVVAKKLTINNISQRVCWVFFLIFRLCPALPVIQTFTNTHWGKYTLQCSEVIPEIHLVTRHTHSELL